MSVGEHQAPAGNGRRHYLIYAWLGALTIFFISVATIDLANHRPISGDDGWILSTSYKLATEGTLGSDMYAGFFNAEEHYFIALPGQHVVQALFIRLFGPGISQARWASVISGVVLLWSVCLVALRWYGAGVAGATSLLLLFWQPALVGEGSVPLVSLSRSLRYDLPTVAWIWLTILFLDGWLQRPTVGQSIVTGLTAAAATLTQFFGILAVMIVPMSVLVCGRRRRLSKEIIAAWVAGFFSLVGPYLLYVSMHWQDAVGQTVYIKGERANLGAGALINNLLREPHRYRHIAAQLDFAPGPWMLLLGVLPALAYLVVQIRRNGRRGDKVLMVTIAATLLFLALADTTKAPIYALPLLPPLCVAFALLTTQLLRRAVRRKDLGHRAAGVVVLGAFGLTVLHGFHFYYRDLRAAASVSDYEELGTAIDAATRPGATVGGSERWWWPLRNRKFMALNNLSVQWRVRRDRRGRIPSFATVLVENEIEEIIVDADARGNMRRQPERLQQQFWAFISECTRRQEQWTDATYGEISLHTVTPACR